MQIDCWPIVGRSQLVRAFRPGEESSKEAPFRTLRAHGWATAGVSVVTRGSRVASGRLTLFSVLNLDAARLARDGDHRHAARLVRAAEKLEQGTLFLTLKQLLTGRPLKEVSGVLEGGATPEGWSTLHGTLQRIARQTRALRARAVPSAKLPEVISGTLSEEDGLLVLTTAKGTRTAVPRWLAQAVHRDRVGDCLALVADKLDDQQLVVHALPGIETTTAAKAFSPFGRRLAVHPLSREDAEKLSGRPAPLKIMVPVSIDA